MKEGFKECKKCGHFTEGDECQVCKMKEKRPHGWKPKNALEYEEALLEDALAFGLWAKRPPIEVLRDMARQQHFFYHTGWQIPPKFIDALHEYFRFKGEDFFDRTVRIEIGCSEKELIRKITKKS